MALQSLPAGRKQRRRSGSRSLKTRTGLRQSGADQGGASPPRCGQLHGRLVEVYQAFVSNILQMKYNIDHYSLLFSILRISKSKLNIFWIKSPLHLPDPRSQQTAGWLGNS